jgi:hypothetical protein
VTSDAAARGKNMTNAPRILDSVLDSATREKILDSLVRTREVLPEDRELAIDLIVKAFSYARVTRAEAERVVDDGFMYYSVLAKHRASRSSRGSRPRVLLPSCK